MRKTPKFVPSGGARLGAAARVVERSRARSASRCASIAAAFAAQLGECVLSRDAMTGISRCAASWRLRNH